MQTDLHPPSMTNTHTLICSLSRRLSVSISESARLVVFSFVLSGVSSLLPSLPLSKPVRALVLTYSLHRISLCELSEVPSFSFFGETVTFLFLSSELTDTQQL